MNYINRLKASYKVLEWHEKLETMAMLVMIVIMAGVLVYGEHINNITIK